MSGKIICPKCNGNGYVYSFSHDDRKKIPMDCDYCHNQGEVDITEDVMKDLEQMKSVN
jgi:DnaJ-class molecular chaperone